MESSRSDHPPQTVSRSDRQQSQTVIRSDRQQSQTVSRSDRQPLHDMQGDTCGAPLPSQCTANGYLAMCQHQARHEYTLPPGVSGEGLSEFEISRGYFKLHPNDRYTVHQQDLLDEDQDMGSEGSWKYRKDDDIDSEESYHSLETHALDDGPPPPPPAASKAPPTPRVRGPPAPTEDRVVQPPPFMRLPPTPMPPAVPNRNHADTVEPYAQPRSDLEEFDKYVRPNYDAAIHTDAALSHMDGRTSVLQPLDSPPLPFWRDCPPTQSQTIQKRVMAELRGSQLSRGPSGATRSESGASSEEQVTIFPPTPSRRPAQPPPPLPSSKDPLRRPAQPPPPLPPPSYCLEYFKNCVRIKVHWEQHLAALQHFRDWCRKRGETSVVLDSLPCEAADWSTDRPTWCWDSLLAHLTDDSLRRVVEGTHGASGIVACMVREGSEVDGRRRSAADQALSSNSDVLYHWEFAFLRNDRTVAFLRPLSSRTCSIDYYEGVPKDESPVGTQTFRRVTTPATDDESLPEFCFGEYGSITRRSANRNQHWPIWVPNMSSLDLGCYSRVKFFEHKAGNIAKRGSAFRAKRG